MLCPITSNKFSAHNFNRYGRNCTFLCGIGAGDCVRACAARICARFGGALKRRPHAKDERQAYAQPRKALRPRRVRDVRAGRIGWAKPVPINSANFRRYKLGLFTTAIAGVVTNYVMALIFYPFYLLCVKYLDGGYGAYFLREFFRLVCSYNLSIAVFNLLPLFPLDGFRVLESLTKPWNRVRQFLQRYGQIILLVLIAESFICGIAVRYFNMDIFGYFDILGYVMYFATYYIGMPIRALWGLII